MYFGIYFRFYFQDLFQDRRGGGFESGLVSWGGMTRGNASGFWSLTVLLGGQGFFLEIRCTQGFI